MVRVMAGKESGWCMGFNGEMSARGLNVEGMSSIGLVKDKVTR